jgi:GntR family transcriptional regulator
LSSRGVNGWGATEARPAEKFRKWGRSVHSRFDEGVGEIRPIDRSSPVPYYYQLQEILKEEIEQGRWAPGELIPSEAELASFFGVSRTVIRKALDVLEADGQLYRVKGKGTLVARPKFRYEAVAAAEGWARGAPSVSPTLSQLIDARRVSVGGHVGRLLDLPPQEEVFELVFVHSIGDSPASLGQMFLREDASPVLAKLASERGLPQFDIGVADAALQLSRRYGLDITESQVTVEATLANEFEAEVLGVRVRTPMFLLSSIDARSDGVPVAFTRTVVRSDQFHFSVLIRRALTSDAAGVVSLRY